MFFSLNHASKIMIKKLLITSIIIYLSIILTTSSPFQDNNLFQDKVNTSVNHNIQSVYAQGNDDNDDDDNGNGDVDPVTLTNNNSPVLTALDTSNDSLLSFSSPVGNQSSLSSPQPDNQLVGYPSPSKDKNFKNV